MRDQTKPARRLYRRRTAAEILNTSISMMKKLEKEGRLKPVRLGSRRAEQIEALLKEASHG
jgi:hypothetical protein